MTVLSLYTSPVDGTIPVTALLYDDERLFASQDDVGLYDGPAKSPPHQSGTIHVTSHRLFFIAGAQSVSIVIAPPLEQERGASIALDLEHITHTESYAGFLKSSAKVTLHLRPLDVQSNQSAGRADPNLLLSGTHDTPSKDYDRFSSSGHTDAAAPSEALESWECEICGNHNPLGLSPVIRNTCELCGMPRPASSSATPITSSRTTLAVPLPISLARIPASVHSSHLYSRSLPSSTAQTPAPASVDSTPATPLSGGTSLGQRKRKPSSIACSACTFLNHPSLRECELCGTPLRPAETESGTNAQLPHAASKSAPTSRPVSPDGKDAVSSSKFVDERERYIKLSFRKGGDKAFYAALKTALQQKGWETRDTKLWKVVNQSHGGGGGLSGISGLLQNLDSAAESTKQGMSDAFTDLEALMSKAQVMVSLAKDLNEQLTAASRNPSASEIQLEPEEATFVRSSLAQLGLSMKNTAVTSDMSNDEKAYIERLAIELAGVLENEDNGKVGIMRQKGIIGLDEVWGGWNRARGIALISPEMTMKTLSYLPFHTHPPIRTRTLRSGLRVLHTPAYSLPSFTARIVARIVDKGPCTSTRFAAEESLSVGLVDELIKEVEDRGDICRDDPMAATDGEGVGVETRWWGNAFTGYVWDGQD